MRLFVLYKTLVVFFVSRKALLLGLPAPCLFLQKSVLHPCLSETQKMKTTDSQELINLRRRASRFLVLVNWIHIPIIVAATLWIGRPVLTQTIVDVIVAAIPTAMWIRHRSAPATRYLNAAAYILQVSFPCAFCSA